MTIIAGLPMQQDELDAIARAIQAANSAPVGAIIIFGILLLGVVATMFGVFLRVTTKNVNPMVDAFMSLGKKFDSVFESNEDERASHREREQKHEETNQRFLEIMEGYRASIDQNNQASAANTAVLIELKNNLLEQNRIESERNKELINFVGGLVNSVKQDVAVHDKHATDRYAQIDAQLKVIQEELHRVLNNIDQQIRELSAKPAPTIDFSPVTTPLVAIQKAINKMASQFVGLEMTPVVETKETG